MDSRENLRRDEGLRAPEIANPQKFDTTIVFGQGPIKEVKLASELSDPEIEIWERFKSHPASIEEPDFYILPKDPGPLKRREMQHMGRFALKRLGRFNALAAGYALLVGQTNELIFSGGRTTTVALRKKFEKQFKESDPLSPTLSDEELARRVDQYIKYMARWPSEAELMADIVRRRYGRQYREKYGKGIEEALRIEDEATNTIENIVLIINKHPEVLGKRVGLLTSNHHVDRARILANTFDIESTGKDRIKAQDLLERRARARKRNKYSTLLEANLPEISRFTEGETRLMRGLSEPQFLEYWIGYVGKIENPSVLQHVLKKFQSEGWKNAMRVAFQKIGLDFDKFNETDLIKLSEEDPELYDEFRSKLVEFTYPKLRLILPGPAIKN